MSPLEMIRRATKRDQALKAAQMAHLMSTAYRGVDTTGKAKPFPTKREDQVLRYRGQSYIG